MKLFFLKPLVYKYVNLTLYHFISVKISITFHKFLKYLTCNLFNFIETTGLGFGECIEIFINIFS